MDPWSPSYQSHGVGRTLEIMTIQTINQNQMYVAKSRPRMLDHASPMDKVDKAEKSAIKSSWWNDPEKKRKRRVTKYKLYSVEGKFKDSFKQGFQWLKRQCSSFARRF